MQILSFILLAGSFAAATPLTWANSAECTAAFEKANADRENPEHADNCPRVRNFEFKVEGAVHHCRALAHLTRVVPRCALGEELLASLRIGRAGKTAAGKTNSQGAGYDSSRFEYLYSGENARASKEKILSFRERLRNGMEQAHAALRKVYAAKVTAEREVDAKAQAIAAMDYLAYETEHLNQNLAQFGNQDFANDFNPFATSSSGWNSEPVTPETAPEHFAAQGEAPVQRSSGGEGGQPPVRQMSDSEVRGGSVDVANVDLAADESNFPSVHPINSALATAASPAREPAAIEQEQLPPANSDSAITIPPMIVANERLATAASPRHSPGEAGAPTKNIPVDTIPPALAAAQPPAPPHAIAALASEPIDSGIPARGDGAGSLSLDSAVNIASADDNDPFQLLSAATALSGDTTGASKMLAGDLVGRLTEIEAQKELANLPSDNLGSLADAAAKVPVDGAAKASNAPEGELLPEIDEQSADSELAAKTAEGEPAVPAPGLPAVNTAKLVDEMILAELGIPKSGPPEHIEAETGRDPALALVALDIHHPDSLFHALAATLIEIEDEAAAEETKSATSAAGAAPPAVQPAPAPKKGEGALAWAQAATSLAAGP